MLHNRFLQLLVTSGVILSFRSGSAAQSGVDPASVRGLLRPNLLPATTPVEQSQTPAEIRIAQAHLLVKTKPEDIEAHNALALALARRARETGNPQYYDEAG